jgi:uncharacterized protein YjbJ (UPF0337 family)
MDKDRIQGKMEDVAGRAKRQVGEWTGDEKTQAEGLGDQIKGKARNAIGKVKDAARDLADDVRDKAHDVKHDAERKKEEDAA